MRPASSNARPCTPAPPSINDAAAPWLDSARAAATTASLATLALAGAGVAATMLSAGPQAVSAGNIRVAILPGGCRATLMAAAASADTVAELFAVRTQSDMGPATPAMLEVSGA